MVHLHLGLILAICVLGASIPAKAQNVCSHPKNPPDKNAQIAIEKLINDFVNRQGVGAQIFPTHWPRDLKTKELDVNALTKSNYEAGRAYGAIAFQAVELPFEQVKKRATEAGMLFKLVKNVRTLKNQHQLEASVGSDAPWVCLRTDVKVPVLSDFHTDVLLRLREISDARVILEWKQVDDYGELSYNQGAAIVEPNGTGIKATVMGALIIKPKHAIGWVARSKARSFVREHYGDYIAALLRAAQNAE